MYYTTLNNEDAILKRLAEIEKEFAKIDKLIAELYTLIEKHGDGHYALVHRIAAAKELGISNRQMDRYADAWAMDKIRAVGGIHYRRSQINEIKRGLFGTRDELFELRRIVQQRRFQGKRIKRGRLV